MIAWKYQHWQEKNHTTFNVDRVLVGSNFNPQHYSTGLVGANRNPSHQPGPARQSFGFFSTELSFPPLKSLHYIHLSINCLTLNAKNLKHNSFKLLLCIQNSLHIIYCIDFHIKSNRKVSFLDKVSLSVLCKYKLWLKFGFKLDQIQCNYVWESL